MSTNGNFPQPDPRLAVLTATDKYYFVAVEYIELEEIPGSSIITAGSVARIPQITATKKVQNHVLNVHPITFAFQNQGKYPYFAVIYDRMITKREYEAAMLLISTAQRISEASKHGDKKEDKILDSNLIDASDKFTK
jgi:hypothetical protein